MGGGGGRREIWRVRVEYEGEIERDEDRPSAALVPGWISEMFNAGSFINANLTECKP